MSGLPVYDIGMFKPVSAIVAALLLLFLAPARAQTPDLDKILADIRAKDKGQLAISEEDGRFLRLLIAATIRKAGMTDVVQVVAGDAFAEIPKLKGTFDFVFLDAWKRDYKKFLDMVYPRLEKGGLFTAHNVVNKKGEMPDFLEAIERNPGLWTAIVSPASEGISLSYKK